MAATPPRELRQDLSAVSAVEGCFSEMFYSHGIASLILCLLMVQYSGFMSIPIKSRPS